MVTLRITGACNHRCAICGQFGERGYLKGAAGRSRGRDLPVERYMALVDELAPHRTALNITGGEPFLYSGLMPLAAYAKQRGLTLLVTTNGVRLEEHAEAIVRQQWDVVLVSLDGPEAVHDACRGVQGAFRTVMKGLEALRAHKQRLGSSKPYINTSTTLSTRNVHHLRETFRIGETLRPDLMVVFLSWFTSEALGQRQRAIMRDELGIDPETWKAYVRTFTEAEAEAFEDALIALQAQSWPFDYFIVPDVGRAHYAEYYREPENTFGYTKCAAPFTMTDVLPNGDVVTCRDYIDVTVGSLLETSLLDIWNGPRYRAYRRMMIRHHGLLPQCSRCCGLMGF
jgi:MoaA/NifB/PqqE/SkfB family radical SAM enzyme